MAYASSQRAAPPGSCHDVIQGLAATPAHRSGGGEGITGTSAKSETSNALREMGESSSRRPTSTVKGPGSSSRARRSLRL